MGRAETLPAFPDDSRGDADGLPASEFSLGIRTLSFGRMPADLGSAMLLFLLSGGGDVDTGMGGSGWPAAAAFSSCLTATSDELFLWTEPTSTAWDRAAS